MLHILVVGDKNISGAVVSLLYDEEDPQTAVAIGAHSVHAYQYKAGDPASIPDHVDALWMLFSNDSALSFKKVQTMYAEVSEVIGTDITVTVGMLQRVEKSKVPAILIDKLCATVGVSQVVPLDDGDIDSYFECLETCVLDIDAKNATTEAEDEPVADSESSSDDSPVPVRKSTGRDRKKRHDSMVSREQRKQEIIAEKRLQRASKRRDSQLARREARSAAAADASGEEEEEPQEEAPAPPKKSGAPKMPPVSDDESSSEEMVERMQSVVEVRREDPYKLNATMEKLCNEIAIASVSKKARGKKLKKPLRNCWRATDAVQLIGLELMNKACASRCFVNGLDREMRSIADDEDLWQFWEDSPGSPVLNIGWWYSVQEKHDSPVALSASLLRALWGRVRQKASSGGCQWLAVDTAELDYAAPLLQMCDSRLPTVSFWINLHNLLALHQACLQRPGRYLVGGDLYSLDKLHEKALTLNPKCVFLLVDCRMHSPPLYVVEEGQSVEDLINEAAAEQLKTCVINLNTSTLELPYYLKTLLSEKNSFTWFSSMLPGGYQSIIRHLKDKSSLQLKYTPQNEEAYPPRLPNLGL